MATSGNKSWRVESEGFRDKHLWEMQLQGRKRKEKRDFTFLGLNQKSFSFFKNNDNMSSSDCFYMISADIYALITV